MKRKTVNSILKGVAGVGLTLGGVSALSDANLVFAATSEETTGDNGSNETVPEGSIVVDDTLSNESNQNDSAETGKSDYETKRQEHLDSQPDATCTMNTVADAMIKAAEEAQKSADATVTNGEDQSDANVPTNEKGSEGGLGGEDTTKTLEEGREESSETDVKSPEEKLAELKKAVDGAHDAVNEQKSKAGDGKVNTNYYRAADELVKLMVEYYAVEAGFDGTVEFNNPYVPKGKAEGNGWVSDGVDHKGNCKQNYLATTYKDALGEVLDIIYYDYVNADKEGEILTDTEYQDVAKKIDHIVVYEKAPVFAIDKENGSFTFDKDGNFSGTDGSFTFVRDECRNIIAYIIDGQKIEVKVDDNGERFIADSENKDGSVVTTTVTGNNDSGYTVTKTTFVTNEAGEKEQTSQSERLYKELKGFSSGYKGKGEVYKTDLPEEPEKETETSNGTGVIVISGVNNSGLSESPTPQPEAPAAEIEDEDVPLADVPDVADEDIDTDDDLEEDLDEDVTDLEDEDVPLAVLDLDEPVDIPDADVPLSDNPETGDALTATWIGTAAASVAGLFGASRKKRKG